jgi:hypothetical protein
VVADYGAGLVRRVTITGAVVDTFSVPGSPIDVTCLVGDVYNVLGHADGLVHRYDQTTGGYGEAALELVTPSGTTAGTWMGPGNRVGAVQTAEVVQVQGPAQVTVRAKHRATVGEAVLTNIAVSAIATPRG